MRREQIHNGRPANLDPGRRMPVQASQVRGNSMGPWRSLIQQEGELVELLLEFHTDPPQTAGNWSPKGRKKKKGGASLSLLHCLLQQRPAASGKNEDALFGHSRWQPPQLLCAHLVIAGVNESVRVTAIQRKLRMKASTCQLHCTGYPAMGGEGVPQLRRGSAACGTLLPTQHNWEASRASVGGCCVHLWTINLTREKNLPSPLAPNLVGRNIYRQWLWEQFNLLIDRTG